MPPMITCLPTTTSCFCFGKHLSRSLLEGLTVPIEVISSSPMCFGAELCLDTLSKLWSCALGYFCPSTQMPVGHRSQVKEFTPVQLTWVKFCSHPTFRKLIWFPEVGYFWGSAWRRKPQTLKPRVRMFHSRLSGTSVQYWFQGLLLTTLQASEITKILPSSFIAHRMTSVKTYISCD